MTLAGRGGDWDAIIAGSGPAGATVARALAANGERVLLLEKGHDDTGIHIPRMLRRKEMMFIGGGRTLVRGIRTGGSSILYYGTAFAPRPEIFAPYGISLAEELAELRRELPIAPLPAARIGPAARLIMDSALALGYPWRPLDKLVYQDRPALNEFPFGVQWNAVEWVREAVKAGAELRNGAAVLQVITEGSRAIGVEYAAGGEQHIVHAPRIILAAGGIASAQILLASGVGGAGEGFFCDPLVIVQGVVPGLPAGREMPMTAGMVCEREGFVLTDLTVPKLVYQLFAAQKLRLDRLASHAQSIAVMVKIKDDIGGRITREGKVHKAFTAADRARMREGTAVARRILEQAGARNIFRTAWTSAHPGGSVRIGDVVDANLQTQVSGLYVCDCSVIPTAWGLPPTLTVLALAKRLAKHLLNR